MAPGGVRIGAPAMTSRGLKEAGKNASPHVWFSGGVQFAHIQNLSCRLYQICRFPARGAGGEQSSAGSAWEAVERLQCVSVGVCCVQRTM